MVRAIGVSHKSLLVSSVTEGTYSIRYEHADYLDRDFNITVGHGLPTTFSEAMVAKIYAVAIEKWSAFPGIFENDTVMQWDPFRYSVWVRNIGNTPINVRVQADIEGIELISEVTPALDPAGFYGYTRSRTTEDLSVGNNTMHVTATIVDTAITETLTQTLHVTEWNTDVTFVATAPEISDLHGVEVFIDNVSMGTT